MEEETDKTDSKQNRPWLYQKGQSGNPKGRPKGKKTMKTYIKERFEKMTVEEREVFLDGLPKEIVWKMAEGNPSNDDKMNLKVTLPEPILKIKK